MIFKKMQQKKMQTISRYFTLPWSDLFSKSSNQN